MTKHDAERGASDEPRDNRSTRERQTDAADEAAVAESARVANLQPGEKAHDGSAPVEPHAEHFPHQPHGQAGQPQNRPAHEGHQGVTPIQPEGQNLETGLSPTQAVTHGEPSEVVDTEYARHGGGNAEKSKDHSKAEAGHGKTKHEAGQAGHDGAESGHDRAEKRHEGKR